MRAQASGIERLLARSLPLALMLGMLSAALGSLVAPRGQVAHADNPSVNIVSPTSAQGPVQTGIRVVGTGWNPGDTVQIYYNPPANNQPCGDPNNSQALAQANPVSSPSTKVVGQEGGAPDSWTIDFQWPNTPTGPFYICAFDVNTPTQVTPSNQPFNVLSTTLPSISINKQFPNIGDQITVSGQGFLPGNQPIDLFIAAPGQTPGTQLGTATAGTDGSFSKKVTLPASPSGQVTISAFSRTPVSGALPPLSAAQQITVGATPSTPTPTPTSPPTPVPSATAPATASAGASPKASSTSGLILTLLVVLLALTLLAIIGVLIWYVTGTRPPAGFAAPGMPPAPARARAPAAPRGMQDSWQSLPDWQADDEWEGQQGPWEEDSQGGWNDLPTQWGTQASPWPPNQGGPSGPLAPPTWSGPAGPGPAGAPRPAPPRMPDRDDWPGRARPGQDDW